MTTSTQELPGGKLPDAGVDFPALQSVEELDRHIEGTYGTEVLQTLKNSTMDQASVLDALHKQGLNGRAERVHELYRVHEQEFARKETLMGSVWNTTKEVVSAPFRWTWSAFKSHPILTTAAVAGLALGGVGAYLYSAGQLETTLSAVGLDAVKEYFLGAAAENAPLTAQTPIVPFGGEAAVPGGTTGLNIPD